MSGSRPVRRPAALPDASRLWSDGCQVDWCLGPGPHGDPSTTPQITRETPDLPWSADSIAGETVQVNPSRLVSFPLSYRRDKTIEDGPTQGGGLNAVGVWLGTGHLQ